MYDVCVLFRQVTLFEELVLLKEYEKREDVIAAKVMSKQQEKLEMQAKVNRWTYFFRSTIIAN